MISNIGAGCVIAASAVYGARTLVCTNNLFWRGLASIGDKTGLSKRYEDFRSGLGSDSFLANYILPTPLTSTAPYTNILYSIVTCAAISGVLLEAGFRLADSPETVLNVLNGGAKFLSPMRIANETMLTVFKSIRWSALWSRA